jgi:YidC/Oxa1 family membrane protein insertase
MENNKNLLLFVVLSVLIVLGYNSAHKWLQPEGSVAPAEVAPPAVLSLPATPPAASTFRERSDVIAGAPRVPLRTQELAGSINLKGARFDDLVLTHYRETVDASSPLVTLLSPAGSAPPYNAYYAEFGWLADSKDVAMPASDSEWKAEGKELSPARPLKLSWKNEQGLSFEREIDVDNYNMFTLTDRVVNGSSAPVTLYPFGLVARQGDPVTSSSSILHEGPLGVLGGALEEFKYKKLMEDGKKTIDSKGGWLGITSKYWLVAMSPDSKEKIVADFAYDGAGASDPAQGHFQADFRGSPVTIEPGASASHVTRFFAGAKQLRLLDAYADKYDIPHFDRAIDFGWFYFLTKPFLYMLSYMGLSLGSLGVAILIFTVMLKFITLPLSLKSNHSMARMKALQPEVKRIQERFGDDKIRQNQEMMALFKREKVSPMSGCVPTLIQIPIFFALYKVLYVGIEMRQAPFFGWIRDMSSPDPTSALTLFGLLSWTPPAALHIGAWPILMGCSMFLQQRLAPQTMDKSQARMFMFMPILFTYMLANMPAGLVIYWTWSNLLSILQQWFIMSRDAKGKV